MQVPVAEMAGSSPGRRPFFKYASLNATLAILQGKSVRFSSPLTFNDPFDIQSGLHFDFDLGTLHSKVLDRIQELAAADSDPPIDPTDPWGKLVLEARRHFPTHGFPREKWEAMTSGPFGELLKVFSETQRLYQDHWRNTLPRVRVFCVSEDRDSLLMWAHYARDHTGAVFELWSLPDEDNPLSVAQAVEYVDTPPPFFTEREWLDDLLSIRKVDLSALNRRYALVKSSHWSYEREWRVWYTLANEGYHDLVPIRQSEFGALYFGCRAKDDFVADAAGLVRSHFPNARLFRARKLERAFGLEYSEM